MTATTPREQRPPPGLISSRPLHGILLLVAATLLFASNDAANKYLVGDYNVPLVAPAASVSK